jgi:hypothetical protein
MRSFVRQNVHGRSKCSAGAYRIRTWAAANFRFCKLRCTLSVLLHIPLPLLHICRPSRLQRTSHPVCNAFASPFVDFVSHPMSTPLAMMRTQSDKPRPSSAAPRVLAKALSKQLTPHSPTSTVFSGFPVVGSPSAPDSPKNWSPVSAGDGTRQSLWSPGSGIDGKPRHHDREHPKLPTSSAFRKISQMIPAALGLVHQIS